MTGSPAECHFGQDRDTYVQEFLDIATLGVAEFSETYAERFDGISTEVNIATGTVHAEAALVFRGRHIRFRRQIWPPGHPARLQAALYDTHLEERLLAFPLPAEGGEPESPIRV